jgi:hypothetical protein
MKLEIYYRNNKIRPESIRVKDIDGAMTAISKRSNIFAAQLSDKKTKLKKQLI